MIRRCVVAMVALGCVVTSAAPAGACAGLVTAGGSVRLVRTATLAAWNAGVEHYVTSFRFEGGGAEFGSIVPLPGVPSTVERGGDWTLQRLQREVQPRVAVAAAGSAEPAALSVSSAQVVYETRIDALDVTVLKGGGAAVGQWAREHGFQLTPDAPAVLTFYAERSPVFLAARFDAQAARDRGQSVGDGTPIHLTIPLARPWVPLRILGLGLGSDRQVNADVFLLTPLRPALRPLPQAQGMVLERSEAASDALLTDLRTDKGMEWMPTAMWLSYLRIDDAPARLRHDLAIEPLHWWVRPSAVAAGLRRPAPPAPPTTKPAPTTAPASTTTAQSLRTDALTRQFDVAPAAHRTAPSRTPATGLAGVLVLATAGAVAGVRRRQSPARR